MHHLSARLSASWRGDSSPLWRGRPLGTCRHPISRLNAFFLCAGTAVACFAYGSVAFGQQPEFQPELNARDAFWSSADLVGKRPAAPAHANTASHRTRISESAVPNQTKISKPSPSVSVVDSNTLEKVSVHAPLGLRYAVLKKLEDGTYQEISPEAVFHAGDQIRLSLMSNQEGFLYVIEQGSSGRWVPLYPAGSSTAEGNKLVPGKEYIVPATGAWRFTGEPGQEKLFVMLSRTPETNLDETIAALRNRQEGLNDQLVAQLRSEVQSRDLVFTSGDDTQTSGQSDKASYVVNKATNQTPDPHVVVDVVLSHK